MKKQFQFRMDKQLYSEGFLMFEVCAVIFIISIFSVLFLNESVVPDFTYYRFLSIYTKTQSDAMLEKTTAHMEQIPQADHLIWFNQQGNVNQAQTIYFQERNKKIVIELGSGRLVYE